MVIGQAGLRRRVGRVRGVVRSVLGVGVFGLVAACSCGHTVSPAEPVEATVALPTPELAPTVSSPEPSVSPPEPEPAPMEAEVGPVDVDDPEELRNPEEIPALRDATAELLTWLDAHPGAHIATTSVHLADAELVSTDAAVLCIELGDGTWEGVQQYVVPASPGTHCFAVSPTPTSVALLDRDAGASDDDEDSEEPIPYSLFVRLDGRTFRLGADGLVPAQIRLRPDEHWSGEGAGAPVPARGARLTVESVDEPSDLPRRAIRVLEAVHSEGACVRGPHLFACSVGETWRAVDSAWVPRLGAPRSVHFVGEGIVVESEECAHGSDVSDCGRIVHVLRVEGERLRIEGSILVAERESTHFREFSCCEREQSLTVSGWNHDVEWDHRILGPRCVAFDEAHAARDTYENFRPAGGAWRHLSDDEIPSRVVLVDGPSVLPRVPLYVDPELSVGEATPLAPERASLDGVSRSEPVPEEVPVFDRRGVWELRGERWERVDACSS